MLQTFETDRLILRERTLEDIEQCMEMDQDPEVVKYIPEIMEVLHGPKPNLEKHKGFVIKRLEADYPDGLGYWTIESKEHGRRFMGWILLIPADGIGPEVEIGWRLKRIYWGKGYATEAAKTIVDHAFDTVGLAKVIADIHYLNQGSIRVAEKLGFRLENTNEDSTAPYVSYSIDNKSFFS
ncbi:GNAT family N-acetyltransferase [Halobacillus salinarum]|uniref:GNAT family N-acetyltransferase n=1 Tax=Halobacillus salinarum TaxID=2932257 RepID=A0ABY4EM28_9BACI|nr:GNAT family N-acetyltransferase [Halobacillus salinarum]UOQ45501.1 GNAT family N-acetyltransferase [Halobacillus salinarum]